MKKLLTLSAVAASAAIFVATSAAENFVDLWSLGVANDTQSDFGTEQGGASAAPGSATTRDDDYYFAGTYPDPIGIVGIDEPFLDFERAILTVDPRVRIHFNLSGV